MASTFRIRTTNSYYLSTVELVLKGVELKFFHEREARAVDFLCFL